MKLILDLKQYIMSFSDEMLAAQLLRYSSDKVDQQMERKRLERMFNALKCTKGCAYTFMLLLYVL